MGNYLEAQEMPQCPLCRHNAYTVKVIHGGSSYQSLKCYEIYGKIKLGQDLEEHEDQLEVAKQYHCYQCDEPF